MEYYKGKIKNIDHIVVSDPTYKKGVWCRYEVDNLKEKDWDVILNVIDRKYEYNDLTINYTEFSLLLSKGKEYCRLDNKGNLAVRKDLTTRSTEIGMDTACIALGINNYAKEIINLQEEWQPSCAIRTGTDGMFGDVIEGSKDGNICLINISGSISDDFCNKKELVDYLVEKFEIKDLEKNVDINVMEL